MSSPTITRVTTATFVAAFGLATVGPALAASAHPANTFQSAYAFKSSHKVGKRWKVAAVKVIRNANNACKKADAAFYHAPKKGYQYVVVDVKMKKLSGGPKETMGTDITFNLATNGLKHTYGEVLGIVAPNDASSQPAVGKGQSVTGAYTFEVRKSDVKKVDLAAQDDEVLDIAYFKL